MLKNKTSIMILTCSLLMTGLAACDADEPLPPESPEAQGLTEQGIVTSPDASTIAENTDESSRDADYQNIVRHGMETQTKLACGDIDEAEYKEREQRGLNDSEFTSLEEYEYLQAFSEGVSVIMTRYEQDPQMKQQDCAHIASATASSNAISGEPNDNNQVIEGSETNNDLTHDAEANHDMAN